MLKKLFKSKTTKINRLLQMGAFGFSATLLTFSAGDLEAQQQMTDAVLAPEPTIKATFGPDDVIFSIYGEDVTAAEYNSTIRFSPPPVLGRPDIIGFSIYEYNDRDVIDSIKDYTVKVAAVDAANEYGFTLDDREEQMVEQSSKRILQLVFLEKNGVLAPTEITDAEVQARYDEIKDLRYKIKEELKLQHIFFSTYVDYVVEEGDTLESIAEEISGDKSKVDLILSKEPPRKARNEPEIDADGNEVPPKALVAGETLMVPMNDEEAAKIKEVADQAYQELMDGADFEDVAIKYAENNSKGNPVSIKPEDQEKPILTEFREAFENLEDGEISEPFRTKHGFQIMKRREYIEPSYRELTDAVSNQLKNEMAIDQTNQRYYALLQSLLREYDQFDINTEVLENVDDTAMKDQVIIQVDDVKYPAETYMRDFGMELTEDTTLQEKIDNLAKLPMVGRKLSEWKIEQINLTEDEAFKSRVELIRGNLLKEKYFQYLLEEVHPFDPTEEELREHYNTITESLAALPSTELYQISLLPEEEVTEDNLPEIEKQLKDELRKELEGVTTLEEFQETAKRISEDAYAEKGGSLGKVSSLFEDGYGQYFLKPQFENSVYGPVLMQDYRVSAFWVGEIDEIGDISFEDAEQGVRDSLEAQHNAEISQLAIQNLLDRAELEIKIGN